MDLRKKIDDEELYDFLEEVDEPEELDPIEEEYTAIGYLNVNKSTKGFATPSTPVPKPETFGNGKASGLIRIFFLIAAIPLAYVLIQVLDAIGFSLSIFTASNILTTLSSFMTIAFLALMIVTAFLYTPDHYKKIPALLIAMGATCVLKFFFIQIKYDDVYDSMIVSLIFSLLLIASGVALIMGSAGKIQLKKPIKIVLGVLSAVFLLYLSLYSYRYLYLTKYGYFYSKMFPRYEVMPLSSDGSLSVLGLFISLIYSGAVGLFFSTLSEEGAKGKEK